jgi:hypothetical protein
VEDGDDTWTHFVSESGGLFSLMIFSFLHVTRSRVEKRLGLNSLECQFPGFKVQGLVLL